MHPGRRSIKSFPPGFLAPLGDEFVGETSVLHAFHPLQKAALDNRRRFDDERLAFDSDDDVLAGPEAQGPSHSSRHDQTALSTQPDLDDIWHDVLSMPSSRPHGRTVEACYSDVHSSIR